MSVQLNVQGTHKIAAGYVVDVALAVVMMHGGSYSERDGSILGEAGV